jgi:hypothetical protein
VGRAWACTSHATLNDHLELWHSHAFVRAEPLRRAATVQSRTQTETLAALTAANARDMHAVVPPRVHRGASGCSGLWGEPTSASSSEEYAQSSESI